MSIKSTRVSGRDCREFVRERKPFHNSGTNHRHPKGSTLWGEWLNDNLYVVYSYGTHWPLLVNWRGIWFSNEEKSSRTTATHVRHTSPYFLVGGREPSVKVSCYALKDIIDRRRPAPELLVQAAMLKLIPERLIPEVSAIRVGAAA